MNKFISFLLAAAMLLSMAGCGDTPQENTNPTPSATTPGTAAPTTPSTAAPTTPSTAAPTEPTVEPLPEELQSAIDGAMGEAIAVDDEVYRYYGTYSDYIILYRNVRDYSERPLVIGTYYFVDPERSSRLYAIRDGQALLLEDVYESGGITEDQLADIYSTHKGYYDYYVYNGCLSDASYHLQNYHDEMVLTDKSRQQIDEAYYASQGIHPEIDGEKIRYYGMSGLCHILFQELQAGEDTQILCGDTAIRHTGTFALWAVHNGTLFTLEDAYSQGLITDRNIDGILDVHLTYYSDEKRMEWNGQDYSENVPDNIYNYMVGSWQLDYYYTPDGQIIPADSNAETLIFYPDGSCAIVLYGVWAKAGWTDFYWKLSSETGECFYLDIWYNYSDRSLKRLIVSKNADGDEDKLYYTCADGSYAVLTRTDATLLQHKETAYWPADLLDMMGTWVLATADEGACAPPEDYELRLNPDGTGYEYAEGELNNITWWYNANAQYDSYYSDYGPMITYSIEGSSSSYSVIYVSNPEMEEFGQLLISGGEWLTTPLKRLTEQEKPEETTGPVEPLAYTDTAEDILGTWVYESDNLEAFRGALEVQFNADGTGYCLRNNTTYPFTWQLTAQEGSIYTVTCLWATNIREDSYFRYTLRYIADNTTDNYHKLVHTVDLFYDVVLTKVAAPTDSATIAPDEADQALNVALDYLGITRDQADKWTCNLTANGLEYDIGINCGLVHHSFRIQMGSLGISSWQTYPSYGLTEIQARDYALGYTGLNLNDVCYFGAHTQKVVGGELPLWEVYMDCNGIRYDLFLDYYGKLLRLTITNGFDEREAFDGEGIGWQAARDVALAALGLELEDVTYLYIYHPYSANVTPRIFDVCVDETYFEILADNGVNYSEGYFSVDTVLTQEEITQIILEDLGDDVRAIYDSGAYNYDLTCRIHYMGYEEPYAPQMEFEWILVTRDTTYIYRADAFTGEILSRETVDRTA